MRLCNAVALSVLAVSQAAAQLYTNTTTATSAPTAAATPYQLQTPPLDTPWTDQVGTSPWPEYPRPQLRRESWQNLNGIWTYSPATGPGAAPPSTPLDREILIPSCLESAISGIQEQNITYMWFATTFTVPANWTQQVLLNFEAVDYEATVYINGREAGFHRGGYFRFSVDATQYLNRNGTNELLVHVFDPTDLPGYVIPRGKQTLTPEHIFYTPCSGIWQTVWLESAPAAHITQLDVSAGADGNVAVNVHVSSNQSLPVDISVYGPDGGVVAEHQGTSGSAFDFSVDSPELWTPDSPTLYNFTVTLGNDVVSSYTGFRTISSGFVDGVKRPLLNGEFVFQFGTLDQGYWPDGIYTPPNHEAMVFDLQVLKNLGMNMVRKHIKVEPDVFYQACDTLGLLVIQDMPSMLPDEGNPTADQQAEWERQIELLINEHKSYTSIVTWVIYNEGWGQITDTYYPEFAIADRIIELDPTRLIDATSGWHDHGAGNFSDNHHYATPQCGTPFYSLASSPYDPERIGFQGEFGGIGHNVSIEHLWNVQAAIDTINQTYEINADLASYNYRAHVLFTELEDQVALFACSGAVWTQTTDVEGEVNGLVTYDRRIERPDVPQWQGDIQGLYDAAATRGGVGGNGTAQVTRQDFSLHDDHDD